MSNPAVIVLSKSDNTKYKFVIEDNIGESIHLHYGDFRIDLTTRDFLKLEPIIEDSLENLIHINNFEIKYFDPSFIKSISRFLPDLEKVTIESIDINQLIIQRKGLFKLPVLRPLHQSRVLKALKGDVKENNSYFQKNILDKSNQQRVKDVLRLISEKGYPYDNKYIVLFNHQNIIRDGQHRASSLLYNGINGTIPIIRLYFKNDLYNIPKRPWVKTLKTGITSLLLLIARKVFRTFKKFFS